MKALRKLSDTAHELVLCEVDPPELRPGHVLIAVAAAGICGTDVHILHGSYRSEPPVTLGHEVAGTILALGEGVTGWEVGQRVTTETYFAVCGRCTWCRGGRPNLCATRRSIGSFEDGGFAEQLLVPAHNLHALPEGLAFPEAALIEPLACVVRGLLELNRVEAGERVAITGPGPIGLLALQVAKAAGATVVVLGTADDRARLTLAERLGADGVFVVETSDLAARVEQRLGGAPEVVIECSGAAPAAELLLALVAKAGRFIQVGLFGTSVALPIDQVCYKELLVSGSFATTPSSWRRALALAGSGRVALADVVGATYPLSEHQAAFRAVAERLPGKVLLLP